jgi:RND family efflux transporter MFP subunit
MAKRRLQLKNIALISGRIAGLLLAVLLVVALMAWSTGALKAKIKPGSVPVAAAPPFTGAAATARYMVISDNLRAVGTIRAIAPVLLSPRIVGRIVYSRLIAGASVKKGQVLVRLNTAQIKAQFAQAAAAVLLARAQLRQAVIDQMRDKKLLVTGDVTTAAMDLANTAVASDQANVARAVAERQAAQAVLGYATIRSTINGIVMRKYVNVGDTVMPGQMLAKLYDPRKLQLAAVVRESLASILHLGQKMPVRLEGLRQTVVARIRQIVPRVDAQSRSFIVKATARFPSGVWPGMYGNLIIPTGSHRVLVVPEAAIEHVGQLDIVKLIVHGQLLRQTVQPGRHFGKMREILSGVAAGQRVVVVSGEDHQSNAESHNKIRAAAEIRP